MERDLEEYSVKTNSQKFIMPSDIKKDFERAIAEGKIPANINEFTNNLDYNPRGKHSNRREILIAFYECIFEVIKKNARSGERTSFQKNDLQKIITESHLPILRKQKCEKWLLDKMNDLIFGSSQNKASKAYPILGHFIKNFDPGNPKGQTVIDIALWCMEQHRINGDNVFELQLKTLELSKERWPEGRRDTSSIQAGKSILGETSELMVMGMLSDLVKKYPEDLIRTQHDNISAYGDFAAFSLPWNLWISVKSGYAKERLFASGYRNPILGIGFFQDPEGDFKGEIRLRNYKLAGFIAIYLPDKPVTEEQLENNLNTFDAVTGYFEGSESNTNPNGNGKAFYRPISQFAKDMESLLEQSRNNRFTITF